MTKLTDTQLVILSAAAARPDHLVLPPPDTLALNKAALTTVLNSLIKKGLLVERPAVDAAAVWREDNDQRLTLVATAMGLNAIGVEAPAVDVPSGPEPALDEPKVQRASGKADAVLALLQRPEGASVADMNAVTNWQAHTIRAFLSGLRKKGAEVTRSKNEEGKAIYRLAWAS